jgi:hypothetical protein
LSATTAVATANNQSDFDHSTQCGIDEIVRHHVDVNGSHETGTIRPATSIRRLRGRATGRFPANGRSSTSVQSWTAGM